MRYLLTAMLAVSASTISFADDAKPIEIAGMKATPPKEWTLKPPPTTAISRLATYGLPKSDGDVEDTEIVVFHFPMGGGSVVDNLERQRKLFLPAEGKDKVDEKLSDSKVGTQSSKTLDLSGTFKKKPNPMSDKFTPIKDYREVYVALESSSSGTYYIRFQGPAKTVEKHKKAFDEFLASFK